MLNDVAADAVIEQRVVVAAFETTLGGLRTIASRISGLGQVATSSGRTRAARTPTGSGCVVIDEGLPEAIRVPW